MAAVFKSLLSNVVACFCSKDISCGLRHLSSRGRGGDFAMFVNCVFPSSCIYIFFLSKSPVFGEGKHNQTGLPRPQAPLRAGKQGARGLMVSRRSLHATVPQPHAHCAQTGSDAWGREQTGRHDCVSQSTIIIDLSPYIYITTRERIFQKMGEMGDRPPGSLGSQRSATENC